MYNVTEATEDFHKARRKASFQGIMNRLTWKNNDLLSWYEVTSIIKPTSETYLGMKTIPVDRIIGSEGRYHDFSSAFFPKRDRLKTRWVSVDSALRGDVILPPISVFSLGGWYFVRDGNHRVSVAKATGGAYIDAEVVELDSKIPLEPGLTTKEIKKRVVEYERKAFIEQYKDLCLPMEKIVFTSPGAYPDMLNHILVHKYYINQEIKDREITLKEAATSWYRNVYSPIIEAIEKEHLLAQFPGSTEGDMYLWMVKKWDEMKKRQHNDALSVEELIGEVEKESTLKARIKRYWAYLKSLVKKK